MKTIDAADPRIMRLQQHFRRSIEQDRFERGKYSADVMCTGMIVGCVSYLVRQYGVRRAYEVIQGLADRIADEELPR